MCDLVTCTGYKRGMLCLACRVPSGGDLCATCRGALRDAPVRWVEPGVLVRSAISHEGPGRLLVHRLKYDAIQSAADVLADRMSDLVGDATGLVPVPRTTVRRHRYGVDPGVELARALARRTALPVITALRPAVWGRKHAGVTRDRRVEPSFRLNRPVPEGAILVDDVITTGLTIATAARLTGITRAVTSTSRIR